MMTVSALAIVGAAMAIVASAATIYPNFFMMSSSSNLSENRTSDMPQRSRWNPRKILNRCSALVNAVRDARLFHDRLIHQRVDLLPVVPADRAGRRREIHHRESFPGIGPPVG